MEKNFNEKRIIFFPSNNLTASMFANRISFLSSLEQFNPTNINEAIELYQYALTINVCPELLSNDVDKLNAKKKDARSSACKFLNQELKSHTLRNIYDEVELQYTNQFFDLFYTSGIYNKIPQDEITAMLDNHPRWIYYILQKSVLAEKYKTPIRKFLTDNPSYGAEFLIGQFGAQTSNDRKLLAPKSLSNNEIDSIMLDYLQTEDPNLNYVRVLLHWPTGTSKLKYTPSKEVLVKAEHKAKQLSDNLLNKSWKITRSTSIAISFEQRACKKIKVTKSGINLTYSAKWLSTYTDPETILNNFIYLFDYIDLTGRLSIPAHKHENSTFIESIGLHALNEYKSSFMFEQRNSMAIGTMSLYKNFLTTMNIRIEDILQWVVDFYLPSELEIDGFALNLPTEETSTLDKCKAIGPEVERLLLMYTLYVEKHTIDPTYLPYMTFKGFSSIPSLTKNKYVEAGQKFIEHASLLFSDQSQLAFSERHKETYQQFFEMIIQEDVKVEDFHNFYRPLLNHLLEDGTITIDKNGIINPTHTAIILKEIWDNGAIEICKYSEDDKKIVSQLVTKNWLCYSSMLFSTDEADYLSYMFNDSTFSNALGLRNKYNHGNRFIDNPESQQILHDYSSLLVVLVCIILKINDDLTFALGITGIDNFVDWPWIDDSILDAARQSGLIKERTNQRHGNK